MNEKPIEVVGPVEKPPEPIKPGPVALDHPDVGKIMTGKLLHCPGALLEPGSLTQIRAVCGNPTTEFLCPVCWGEVSRATRREFNAERRVLRERRQSHPSPRMKELIEQVLIEAARGRARHNR